MSAQRRASISGPSNCDVCKSVVKDSGVSCSLCGIWLHLKCVEISSAKTVEIDHVFVFCKGCRRSLNCLKSGLVQQGSSESLDAFVKKTDKAIDDLRDTVNQLAEKLEPLLAPDQEVQEQRQKTFAEIAAKHAVAEAKVVIADDVKNVHEEEIRRRSAVVIGLPESSDGLSEV